MKKPKNTKIAEKSIVERKQRMENALVQKESSWVLKQFDKAEKPTLRY